MLDGLDHLSFRMYVVMSSIRPNVMQWNDIALMLRAGRSIPSIQNVRTAAAKLEKRGLIVRETTNGQTLRWSYPNSTTQTYANSGFALTGQLFDEGANSEKGFDANSIIDLYHEVCHMMPRIRKPTDSLTTRLRSADGEVDDWRAFFESAANSQFLSGKKTDWVASLWWLTGPVNRGRVLSGEFDDHVTERKSNDELDEWFKRQGCDA